MALPENPFPTQPLETPKLKSGEAIDKGIVALSFRAQWCGGCKVAAPLIDQQAKLHQAVKLVKIDVDKEGEISDRMNIQSIPTVVFLKDGSEIGRITSLDKKAIAKQFEKHARA